MVSDFGRHCPRRYWIECTLPLTTISMATLIVASLYAACHCFAVEMSARSFSVQSISLSAWRSSSYENSQTIACAQWTVWFKVFDLDGDGLLSKADMLAMVSSLWKVQALKSTCSSLVCGCTKWWHSCLPRERVCSGYGWRVRRSPDVIANELDGIA